MNLLYRSISYNSKYTKKNLSLNNCIYLLLSVTLTLEEIYCLSRKRLNTDLILKHAIAIKIINSVILFEVYILLLE